MRNALSTDTTIDDLELLLCSNFRRISRDFAGLGCNNSKSNEDRH